MPKHALVAGGTGMLRAVTVELLKRFDIVSVIARNENGFKLLESDAGKIASKINRIQVDYTNYRELTNLLLSAVKHYGEFSLCVSWVHSTAPLAPMIIAKILNLSHECEYYEILGSSAGNPVNQSKPREKTFETFENIIYHQVILGFIIEENSSRWLKNDEICNGIMYAIDSELKKHIIGTIEPWDKKPG